MAQRPFRWMKSLSRWISSRSQHTEVIYFLVWALIFVGLAFVHVPWRDEYQAWLIATRTNGWSEFFEAIRYERHPPLQYLLLRGIAGLVHALSPHFENVTPTNPVYLRIVSGFFALYSLKQWLKFKMPAWFKYGVPLGILWLIEYGIVSRCYSMGICFLFLAVRARHADKTSGYGVWLLLAAMTHLLLTFPALTLFCIDLWERRKNWRATRLQAVGLALGFIAVLCFLKTPVDAEFSAHLPPLQQWNPLRFVSTLCYGLTGIGGAYTSYAFENNPWDWKVSWIPVAVLWICARQGFPIIRYFIVSAVPLTILSLGFAPLLRHVGFLYILALVVILLEFKKKKLVAPPKAFSVFVISMLAANLYFLLQWKPYRSPPVFDFSAAKHLDQAMGHELRRADSVLVVDMDYRFFSVMGLMEIDVFDPSRDRMVRFPHFKRGEKIHTFEGWCKLVGAELDTKFPGKTIYFGVQDGAAPPPKTCAPYRLVYESKRYVRSEESYAIYKRDFTKVAAE